MSVVSQNRCLKWLAGLLLLAFGLLAARLADLQVVRHEELLGRANNNTVRTFARDPMRGRIVDIKGNPLATSIPAKLICADPSLMICTNPSLLRDYRGMVAHALAPLLQTNEAYLADRFVPRLVVAGGKTNLSRYVPLLHQATQETWDKVRQTMAALSFGVDESKLKSKDKSFFRSLRAGAIFADDDQKRVYPGLTLAAHVIGYVSGDGEDQKGMNGIELEFNTKLNGVRGWRHTELDLFHHELVPYRDEDVEPRDGLNVVLTLDAGLQDIMESELAAGMSQLCPVSISSVMIRPRTGEILALANCPTFDPNHPGAFPPEALRNRVIADNHEPGSTFKIVVVSGALNEQAVSLTDVFNCEHGHFAYAGAVVHDHEPYGDLTVESIITKSSNIGAAKIGLRLGQDTLYRYIRGFGLAIRCAGAAVLFFTGVRLAAGHGLPGGYPHEICPPACPSGTAGCEDPGCCDIRRSHRRLAAAFPAAAERHKPRRRAVCLLPARRTAA